MDKEQEKAAKARDSALQSALTQIERQFGAGSIMKMGDDAAAVKVAAVPTGALSLDLPGRRDKHVELSDLPPGATPSSSHTPWAGASL